jgi:hypothetical protein
VPIKLAIKRIVASHYGVREMKIAGAAESLLAPYRIWTP